VHGTFVRLPPRLNATQGSSMTEIRELLAGIQQEFPLLRMEYQPPSEEVELCLVIPQQPGLAFEVVLTHEGDELQMGAGNLFWLEWFPSDDEDVVMTYRDAVVGLLEGRYRIMEHYRGGYPINAKLQRPNGEKWETLGVWCTVWGALAWGRSERCVLRNAPSV
jgi:hypothetical protein